MKKLRHSTPPRGFTPQAVNRESPAEPPTWTSRFGRMFPHLSAAKFGRTDKEQFDNLQALAQRMVADFDAPKDGADDEETGIPALYTYFGQFIDHDLTFDPESSFQKKKDVDAVVDFRTPGFDLDNVYGRGPDDQPYLYDEDGKSFLLGDPLTLGSPGARDLQRNIHGRALIGDPRNDENAIVSQLQGLFLAFHNRVIKDHKDIEFAEAQQRVRWHYQYVILNDFLPRIVSASVLDGLKSGGVYDPAKLLLKPRPFPFMPVEFSVAAYRIGHSMVRPGYRLNDNILLPIFPNPPGAPISFPEGLTGFRRLVSDWGIDWGRFIDIDVRNYDGGQLKDFPALPDADRLRRLQFAYRIDTSVVDPLGNLPAAVAGDAPPSLAHRNLLRGVQFGLPSGQEVAKALGVKHLDDKQIIIGKATTAADPEAKPIAEISGIFAGNCPLWTYILAEAAQNQVTMPMPVILPPPLKAPATTADGKPANTTPQLGAVGGRIVAEVFLCLLFSDEGAFLRSNPHWTPNGNANYKLKDFVKYALGQ